MLVKEFCTSISFPHLYKSRALSVAWTALSLPNPTVAISVAYVVQTPHR